MSQDTNVFLEATRLCLRFDAQNHKNLTVEQLWQLPLQTTVATQSDLDGAGKIVKKALREQEEDSIVSTGTNKVKALLELKLAVLLAIVEYKKAENASKAAKAAAASEAQQLEALLETKKADKLGQLSEQEIEKRLADARQRAALG